MKKLKKNSITPLPIYEKSESTSSLLDNNDLNVNTSNELLLSGSKLSIQQDTIEMKRIFDGINFSVYPVDIHLPINLKISLDGILIKCLVDPVDEQNEIFIETASILKYSYNRGKETFKFSAIKTDNVFEEYIFQVENYFELFESVGKSILYYTRCASKVDPLHLELEKLKIEKKNFSESDLNQGKDVKNVKQNLKSASALRSAETLNSPTSVVAANFPKLATQKAKSFSDLKNQDEKIARNTKTLTFPTSIYCEESAKNDKESRSNGIIYDKKPLNIFIKKSPSSPNIPRDIPDFVLRKSVSQTKVSHTSDFDFCPFDGCIKSDEFDLCPSDNSLKIEIESENSTSRSLKLKNLFKVGNSKVPQAKLRPRTISKSERPNSIFLSFEREKGQKGKALLPVSCPEVENTDNKSSSQGDSSNVMKLGRRKTGEANTLRKLLSASKLDRRKSCVSMDDENTVLDTTNTFVNRIEKVLDKFGYEELIKSNDEVVGGTIHALISLLDKNNDLQFGKIFLLTFRSFITVTELVTILLRGYNCEINEFEGKIPQYEKGPVLKLSNSHLFETNKIGIIDAALTKRLNFLKDLISQNLPDFIIALGPRNLILNYLTELEKCDIQEYYELKMLCKDIKYILEKSVIETKMVTAMNYEFYELDLKEELFSKEEVENSEKVKRVNEIIFRLMNFEFLDYSSKLYAEKLTLQDMKLFKLIKAEEFSFFIWENSCKEKYKNLDNFIYRYNQLSHWVATVICTTGDFKKRVATLEKFIKIAKSLFEIKNYNGCMAIWSGLNTSPIYRLKKTFESIGSRYLGMYKELENTLSFNSNYKIVRDLECKSEPPMIPSFILTIKDLTFLNDGNQKKLSNGLINFEKCKTIYNKIQSTIEFQKHDYKFEQYNHQLWHLNENFYKIISASNEQSENIYNKSDHSSFEEYCGNLPILPEMELIVLSKSIEKDQEIFNYSKKEFLVNLENILFHKLNAEKPLSTSLSAVPFFSELRRRVSNSNSSKKPIS